jgi:hypothetical protein
MSEIMPADTAPQAAAVQLEAYRRMAPVERLRIAFEMSDSVRRLSAAGVRSRHHDYSEEQVRLAVIRLSLGEDLFRKAYPGVDVPP